MLSVVKSTHVVIFKQFRTSQQCAIMPGSGTDVLKKERRVLENQTEHTQRKPNQIHLKAVSVHQLCAVDFLKSQQLWQ